MIGECIIMSMSVKREGYQISEKELKELQQVQKELIREVDRICRKLGIQYNMVGGTMLGAIRHKGYIPWDDDADVGFLRSEYEKFREACTTELDHTKYYMQDMRDTSGYRWGYGKLRKKNTKFIRLNQEFMPYEQGISIDLMPFDNIPDGKIKQRIHCFKCFCLRKILWSEVGYRIEKNCVKRMAYKIMKNIPVKYVIEKYQKLILEGEKCRTEQVRILMFPTPKGIYGYNRKWYTELKLYEFEELLLPGAEDFDGYLKVKYGNYMELPPVEKRKIHPASKLVL